MKFSLTFELLEHAILDKNSKALSTNQSEAELEDFWKTFGRFWSNAAL